MLPDSRKLIEQPDILILEGLNVLQSGMDYPHDPHRVFVSDFVDFSIYVDADEHQLQAWYINRFLKFREAPSPTRTLTSIITHSCQSLRPSRLPLGYGMKLTD